MTSDEGSREMKNIIGLVKDIVEETKSLKDVYIKIDAPVNWACIFAHDDQEYAMLLKNAEKIGKIIKETPTGMIFHIKPIETVAGKLRLLKIRTPDITRVERGDADFTINEYDKFKRAFLNKKGFKFIQRENFEMIELMDDK